MPTSGLSSTKLGKTFFNKNSYYLAKSLLGKLIVHNIDGTIVKCCIVETELYPGGEDKGSISYNGRRTAANEPVYMKAGNTFVYLTYGMHHCINISSTDYGGAVLLRAGEPIVGIDKMNELRSSKLKSKKSLKLQELCSGPAKLCAAMGITKATHNALDITKSNKFWIETCGDDQNQVIVTTTRIGINRAGPEAVNQLYRFYIFGNLHVSVRDLEREKEIEKITK